MSQATLTDRPYLNSNLFSGYYLDERVQDLDAWDCDDAATTTMGELQSLYEAEGDLVESYNEDTLVDAWIDEVLDVLGYGRMTEISLPETGGFVDVLLFGDDTARRDAAETFLKSDDETVLFEQSSVLLEAKRWNAAFDERFTEQRAYRNASHQVKHYLEKTPGSVEWGILTNGRKWRLYGTKDYETETFFEVDLPELLAADDLEAFKYFYVFFRPDAFRESAGTTFLETVHSESETAAQELGEDLQDNVFTALRVLGRGFVETNDLAIDPDDEAALDELNEQSLVLLYRLMFVLYAEARGLIHPENPGAEAEYEENFSLDALRLDVHDAIGPVDDGFAAEYSEYSTSMWNRLSDLFRLIDEGEESLGIPPYDGGLFDHEEHAFLTENEVSNRYLAEVVYRLSTTENGDGRYVLADYADLDTRHLGSVYEGLLEHQFRIAPEQYAAVSEDGGQVWKPATEVSVADAVETVEAGGLYVVNDQGERKATGAYYTPDYIVTYIVEETVDPLVEEIQDDLDEQGFERGTQEYLGAFLRRVTDLSVLDPAMGSGHFLTKATGYLAEQVMAEVREFEEEVPVGFDEQHIRREIAKECIYGVDLNGMAVELAKLSMWLETLAADQPLAFLDHHFKEGNSLVGSDLEDIEGLESDANGDDEQSSLAEFGATREGTIDRLMDIYQEFLAIQNETAEDVRAMKRKYAEIEQDELRQRLVAMANVHTAERFDLDVPGGAYERMARGLEDDSEWAGVKKRDWFGTAQRMADQYNFMHWKLEFPEIFYDEDGVPKRLAGFDAIMGNPPYIRIQELRSANSKQADYLLKEYRSATKNFDIYVNFTEQGFDLLSDGGLLGYIEPHKFFQGDFGEKLRKFISERQALQKVLSFGQHQVFEGASVYTCVLILKKGGCDYVQFGKEDPVKLLQNKEIEFHRMEAEYTEEPWVFQPPEILQVLESIDATVNTLENITSKIYQGVVTSADEIFLLKIKEDRDDILVVENGNDEIIKVESELVRPFLKGQDIKRFSPLNPPQHIILPYFIEKNKEPRFIEENTLKEKYPNSHSYFKSNEEKLRQRDGGSMDSSRWYDLTRNQNMSEFSKSKILTPEISYGSNFAYDSEGLFHKSKVYGIVFEDNWQELESAILGLLNSNLLWFFLQNTGYVLRGGYFTFKTEYLNPFGIPSKEKFSEKTDGDEFNRKLSAAVERETEARSELQSINLNLLDYVTTDPNGPTLSEIGLYQPPETADTDSPLYKTKDDLENLRVGEVTCERTGAGTILVYATARYKPENDGEHETDQWGYTETEPIEAFRITDLSDLEADLIETFVPVAADEAGGFAGFRETATKTNSLVDRLKALTLPEPSAVEDDLQNYLDAKARADELDEKIERTDRLIDEIVYELYGLTEEEIEIVEEAVER